MNRNPLRGASRHPAKIAGQCDPYVSRMHFATDNFIPEDESGLSDVALPPPQPYIHDGFLNLEHRWTGSTNIEGMSDFSTDTPIQPLLPPKVHSPPRNLRYSPSHAMESPWTTASQVAPGGYEMSVFVQLPVSEANLHEASIATAYNLDYHRLTGPTTELPLPMPQHHTPSRAATPMSNESASASQSRLSTPISDVDGDEAYAHLLFRCLKDAPDHKLSLKEIYAWMSENSSRVRISNSTGWQNSVRHNLSMNMGFVKDEPDGSTISKKNTMWKLTEEALARGSVFPTTTFRKRGKRTPPRSRRNPPAPQRVQSGSKGGQASRRAAQRRASKVHQTGRDGTMAVTPSRITPTSPDVVASTTTMMIPASTMGTPSYCGSNSTAPMDYNPCFTPSGAVNAGDYYSSEPVSPFTTTNPFMPVPQPMVSGPSSTGSSSTATPFTNNVPSNSRGATPADDQILSDASSSSPSTMFEYTSTPLMGPDHRMLPMTPETMPMVGYGGAFEYDPSSMSALMLGQPLADENNFVVGGGGGEGGRFSQQPEQWDPAAYNGRQSVVNPWDTTKQPTDGWRWC